ncbi:MAG: protein translocase subunit SecD [Armatimonadota bacterium]
MRTHSIWLTSIILLTIAAFIAVFQPVTFTPRKNPLDTTTYLRPLMVKDFEASKMPEPSQYIGKIPLYYYTPQHDLNLGLDLRGGMRVVMQIPDRAEFNYTLKNRLAGQEDIATKQAALTDKVKAALGEEGWKDADVNVTDNTVNITTYPKSYAEGQNQLRMINGVINEVFGADNIAKAPDAGSVYIKVDASLQNNINSIMGRRVNPDGTREISTTPKGSNQVVMEIPGEKDPDHVVKLIGQTANMKFMLLAKEVSVNNDPSNPSGVIITRNGAIVTDEDALKDAILVVRGRDLLPKCDIVPDHKTPGNYAVTFAMNSSTATARFASITGANVNRLLAIVLDNKITSAPVINSKIDGQGEISGNFSSKEATDLKTLLNAGALPVPVKIVETRTVSASLGSDSVAMSLKAGIIGLVLVLAFMGFYYRLPGMMANLALVVYIFLSLAVLWLFKATLTLPGIAGIILSVGMAVDANVIIFERLKEELRTKKPLETAIDVAFARAWTAILDSNVASLITGFVLFALGTGALRGFAVTLMIGVAVSLFTAVTVTRLFMKLMIRTKAGHNLAWYGV